MDMAPKLPDTAVALSNFHEHRVPAGDLAAIGEVYDAPVLACRVEFVHSDGTTRTLLTLSPQQVRRLPARGILAPGPRARYA